MSDLDPSTDNDLYHQYVAQLLTQPREQVPFWIAQHEKIRSQEFLQFLKEHYVTGNLIQNDREKADFLTNASLLIAEQMIGQAWGIALARWMRGMWATFYNAADAVALFQLTLPFYEAMNDGLSVGRLHANLVGVYADCGENRQAEVSYHLAYPKLAQYEEQYPTYFVYLEQNFGWLLHSWGRYAEALETHDRALALATKHNLTEDIPDILSNRCLTLGFLGRISEAESGFLQARTLADVAKLAFTVARIDMNLAELYTNWGRPADALRRFQQSATGFEEMEQGYLFLAQATLYRQLGASSAALTHYELALPILERDKLLSFLAEAQINLAICLRLFGQIKYKKRDLRRRIATLLNASRSHWESLKHEYWLAQIYFEELIIARSDEQIEQALLLLANPPLLLSNPRLQAEFQFLRAETFRLAGKSKQEERQIEQDYRIALAYSRSEGLHWLSRKTLIGLGKFYLQKNWSESRRLLEEAAQIDDQLRQTLSLAELKASVHEQSNDLYDELIRQAFARDEHDLLLHYAWRAKASAFLELAATMRDEGQYTVEQRHSLEQLRQKIAALRWALAKNAEKNMLDARYEVTNSELTDLLDQLLSLRRQANQQQTQISTLTMQQMHNALATMDCDLLIEYVRCDNQLYGICATQTGVCAAVQLANVDIIAEISGHLELAFHTLNAIPATEREHSAEMRKLESQRFLQQCFELLVAPLLSSIVDIEAINKVLIAPCDCLSTLPFAAFWNGTNYWIELHEIELIQSGALLLLETPAAVEHSASISIAASTGNAIAVRDEAVEVAKTINPCNIFVDKPVLGYLSSLQTPPRILHISAHTLQREDVPIFTAIQLTNEVLSVEQSYELPLWGTELVTLSGCLTAGGMTSDASLFAFQSALLLAGARRVLCTLWPIGASIPRPMMVYLYALIEHGAPISTALRQTQLHFMQDSAYSLPAFWAAFTCVRR